MLSDSVAECGRNSHYAMRRQGFDVEAVGSLSLDVQYGYECFENPKVFGTFGSLADQKHINKALLLKRLNAMPLGSYSGIMVEWEGSANGHVFICEKTKDGLQFIDPQNRILDYSGRAH
jgi:hypothetical protein